MILEENKKLAALAMDFSLSRGCQAVRVTLSSGSDTEIEVRDDKIDKLQQSSGNQLTLQIFLNGRYGSFTTNRLDKDELKKFIEEAVESVGFLAPDACRMLPDSERYFNGSGHPLGLYDDKFSDISPEMKISLAKEAAQEILGTDPRIISVQSLWNDGCSFRYMIDSNGFEGEDELSYYAMSVSVSVKGEGESRPESFWYEQSLSFDELNTKNIGRKALERALKKTGQKKVASGRYPMLVENLNGMRLVSPLIAALSGSSLQQKNSFLLDQKNKKVMSEKMTLVDDPHVPHAFGSRYFDNEGVATRKRHIFRNGVLETYFIDTYNALKMVTEPTISCPSHLIMEPGNRNAAEIISGLDKGIFVTGFNGGNTNSTSGDFSFGIEGFLVENGKIVQPVSEMNITGNLLDLWSNLSEVGNDPLPNETCLIPSLLFDNVEFSGF